MAALTTPTPAMPLARHGLRCLALMLLALSSLSGTSARVVRSAGLGGVVAPQATPKANCTKAKVTKINWSFTGSPVSYRGPQYLVCEKGAKVRFAWNSKTPHDLASVKVGTFNKCSAVISETSVVQRLKAKNATATFTLKANTKGTFYYTCTVTAHCSALKQKIKILVI